MRCKCGDPATIGRRCRDCHEARTAPKIQAPPHHKLDTGNHRCFRCGSYYKCPSWCRTRWNR